MESVSCSVFSGTELDTKDGCLARGMKCLGGVLSESWQFRIKP